MPTVKIIGNTKKAVEELGIEAEVQKGEDVKGILKYGVMKTPCLAVDEKVKVMGRVATSEEIKKYLK